MQSLITRAESHADGMRVSAEENPYAKYALKTFAHWTIFLHKTQWPYIGRAYAWATREVPMHRLSNLTVDERHELWNHVLPEYEQALQVLFHPDHVNYAWLGNEVSVHAGHGNLHIIPRYRSVRFHRGIGFHDMRWGANYAPVPPCPIGPLSETFTLQIRDDIAAVI